MSEQDKLANRIPAEQLSQFEYWVLPNVQTPDGEPGQSNDTDLAVVGETAESIDDIPVEEQPAALTAEELARISEEARREGYELGFQTGLAKGEEEGHSKGLKSGEAKAFQQTLSKRNAEIKRLQAIANGLMQPMAQQQHQLENIIVDLAVSLAKQLLGQELQQSPSSLYALVAYVISRLPAGEANLTVHLNSEDARLLRDELSGTENWRIQEDDSLTRGGCQVTSDNSLIDFRLEPRLAEYQQEIRRRGEVTDTDLPPVSIYRSEDGTGEHQGDGLTTPAGSQNALAVDNVLGGGQALASPPVEGECPEQAARNTTGAETTAKPASKRSVAPGESCPSTPLRCDSTQSKPPAKHHTSDTVDSAPSKQKGDDT